MTEQQPHVEKWLTLGEAAGLLGVHATTLRRWADNGDIPVMLTPGGHRRFANSDIERFAQERHGTRRVEGLVEVWADQAMTQTRQEIVVHQDQTWLTHIDDARRDHHRVLGRQLMGLTLQYLADENGGKLLEEARNIGRQYAELGLQAQMPLPEVLQAALFFRDTLVESALQLPESTRVRPDANARLMRRINKLLNAVHLAIAEEYDARYSNRMPRS